MSQLIIQERGREQPFIHTCAEDVITIGRQEDNVIQLVGRGVSRNHAKVLVEEKNHYLVDLKSGNGTFLNGMRITPNEKNLLRPGDLITVDTFDIKFSMGKAIGEEDIIEETTDSDILEVKLLKKVLTALDKEMVPSLEVLNGSAEGKKLFFTDEMSECTIGRDPECDFAINEYVISRRHAKIIKRWGGIAIRDMESKNSTFVNNRRVIEEYLHDGDRIALGTIVLMFRNPQEISLEYLEEIKPKTTPAPIPPEQIPGLEKEEAFEEFEGSEDEAYISPEEEGEGMEEEESEALKEWEHLEKQALLKTPYPPPTPKPAGIKRLTPIEIGMIGLGALVLIFALITVVNLLSA
ncbi:MAG: FHA domain-containing protein [Pseudomonadota bacterium]